MKIDIRYIGPRPEYEDALYGTGSWKHGQVKKVERQSAVWMLVHTDVYEDARKKKDREKYPVKPEPRPSVLPRHHEIDLHPMPANLPVMTKEKLADYAQREFGVMLHPEKMTRDAMLDAVRGHMRERG